MNNRQRKMIFRRTCTFFAILIISLHVLPVFALGMTPGNPITPGSPMTPGNPMIPRDPMTPGVPMIPGNPMFPGSPMTPGDVMVPGDPMTPGEIMKPGVPMKPGEMNQGNVIDPGNEMVPGDGSDPGNVGIPGGFGPGNWMDPGNTLLPGNGSDPGNVGVPGGFGPGNWMDPGNGLLPGNGSDSGNEGIPGGFGPGNSLLPGDGTEQGYGGIPGGFGPGNGMDNGSWLIPGNGSDWGINPLTGLPYGSNSGPPNPYSGYTISDASGMEFRDRLGIIDSRTADFIEFGLNSGTAIYFDAIPAGVSIKYNYRINYMPPGHYNRDFTVSGRLYGNNAWETRQLNAYRGDVTTRGGRFVNMPDSVRQHVDTRFAVGNALNNQFNFLNMNNISTMLSERQWRNPLNMDWMKSGVRGGGPVGIVLGSISNIYDYSPWGNNSNVGYGSTDFASAILTDLTLGAATTAVSTAVGVGSAAAIGAAVGSVVPGVGTIIGVGVGIAISAFLMTERGQRITNAVQSGIKRTLDAGVTVAKNAGQAISNGWSNMTSKVSGFFGS